MIRSGNKNQEDLLQLSSTLSKMLKQRFGKGPESCFVTLHTGKLIVYIRNFITPAEEVLITTEEMNLAYDFRTLLMNHIAKELITHDAFKVLDFNYVSFHQDWDYETNTAILLFEEESLSTDLDVKNKPYYYEKMAQQIKYISAELHKAPQAMELMKISPNLLAVRCSGVMLEIEKVLNKKGHQDLLQERSWEIKKSFQDKKDSFTNIIGKEVECIYILWDYIKDRNFIFFYLQ
ncbi:Na-translocating system protein MpsC family protein [Bacillus sp. S/N-304-OC-R1]|uniref:Na-translocating system protein MpsC family protein n=1 Tax=Bacillus sp. S/N-304-OC-R1 TaxID=2758034 RepID=UPI001C8D7934|nr:Na-translocating system protein MpsC family protein [Bacillus sp. S/N-304-OC-R1]MBY0121761.1 DUF2294 family protein [Bacillus sp. S/N-304-OC-R1]